MRYYVVSDVHGYYSLLMATLRKKGYFEDKGPHKLIVCGDLFDRGSEAVKMQNFIKQLLDKNEVILIRGNHEDLMNDLVKDLSKGKLYMLGGYNRSNGTTSSLLELTHSNLFESRPDEKDAIISVIMHLLTGPIEIM